MNEKKSIIYIRTSTTEQNPENQLDSINTMLDLFEVKPIIYKDQQSAWKDHIERPEFNSLLKLLKGNKVSDIYVWDLDRLYRNRHNLIAFFKLCKYHKCNIHSYRQKWLESLNSIQPPFNEIMHDLMIQIMGWLAEEESLKKSERVKAAVRVVKGVTRSHTGKKWGRKGTSMQRRSRVWELRDQGLSIRGICREIKIGVGTVSKILNEPRV